MKLTKYQHACFTVEENGQVLVVDPGNLSGDFIAPAGVVAVVVTHQHGDHFDPEQLAAIIDKNPEAMIYAPAEVIALLEALPTQAVSAGETVAAGPFRLVFHGGAHATIAEGMPPIANLGVMINDLLYYPGDSFTLPGVAVDTLALPIAAPWMRVSEALAFLATVKPRLAFPTHDAILSESGKRIFDGLYKEVGSTRLLQYRRLNKILDI